MVVLTPSPEGFRKIKGTLSDYSVTRESREKAAAAFLVQDEFEPRLLPKTKSKSLSCSSSLPCSLWAMAFLVVFIALHLEGRSLSDETLFQSSTGDMDRHTYPELIYKKKRMLQFFIALTLGFTTELHHFRYHEIFNLAVPVALFSIICIWHWETFCFLPLPWRSP